MSSCAPQTAETVKRKPPKNEGGEMACLLKVHVMVLLTDNKI